VELGLEKLAMQTVMATMDSIQPHRIAFKSRVVLVSRNAYVSRQFLYGTSRPDTSHIIYTVLIRDGNGENATRACSH
jgi:hypothetical protein